MSVSSRQPEVLRLGDDALFVSVGEVISWETGARVRALAHKVRELHIESVTDVVPAYTSFAVYFNSSGEFAEVAAAVNAVLASETEVFAEEFRSVEIVVRYDGVDLTDVAERVGLTVEQVVELHSSRSYRAYMLGFVPGFAYLGDLDSALVLPRRSVPRVRVPAGSVAIAGEQTAVYPLPTAGGWHLIGSTDAIMFDASRTDAALIRAGDTVRFVPVRA